MSIIQTVHKIFEDNSSRPFLLDSITKSELTYGELFKQAASLGSLFETLGLKKGERIATYLNNSQDFVFVYFACLLRGFVVVPINPQFGERTVSHILKTSGLSLVVLSKETSPSFSASYKLEQHVQIAEFCAADQKPTQKNFNPICLTEQETEELEVEGVISDSDLIAIVYTSGTTSRPKGVCHTYGSMLQNANTFIKQIGLGSESRFYNILSMSYLGGYYNLLLLPFMAQGSVVLAPAFNAASALNFWDAAIEYEVNTFWFVPTIASILLEMDRSQDGIDYCKEKQPLTIVGTAPLLPAVRERFEAKYTTRLYDNYGLSETFFLSCQSPRISHPRNSVGYVIPGVDVRIVDSSGNECLPGIEGEVSVSTPYLMKGYYDAETKNPLPHEGRFLTGDLGKLTSDQLLQITGRKKDLIIRGGVNISAESIEDICLDVDGVFQAAVIGVPHHIYGEDIVCCLVISDSFVSDEVKEKVMSQLKEVLSDIERPSQVLVLDELPMSSSGKVQKPTLRRLLIERLGISITSERPEKDGEFRNTISLPGIISPRHPDFDNEIVEEFQNIPTGIISDCLNRLKSLDSSIRHFSMSLDMCGMAFTVEDVEGGNTMSHLALEQVSKGDILVIDAKGGRSRSVWGGLQTRCAIDRGVRGIIVNGCIRDVDLISECGIPVMAIGAVPSGPLKGWSGNINTAISCAGVVIQPGDLIKSDADGAVVVPRKYVKEILGYAQKRLEVEKEWFEKVDRGDSAAEAAGIKDQIGSFSLRRE